MALKAFEVAVTFMVLVGFMIILARLDHYRIKTLWKNKNKELPK